MNILKFMHNKGMIRSFAEGRRLIICGGTKVNDELMRDPSKELKHGDKVKVGKRHPLLTFDEDDN